MSYVLAALGFIALVVLHELGHFTAAKLVGMRVERFALFFPPIVASVRRGETEYAIGSIPLGGYVKITGMSPAEDVPAEHAHRAYIRQAVWKRIVVIAAGPAVNLGLAFIIFWAILVFQGQGDLVSTNRVDAVQSAAAKQVLRPGDRILAVDGVGGDAAAIRRQIGTHTCAGTPVDGCRAATPARLTIVRDGTRQEVSVRPTYDAEQGRPLVGFAFAFDTTYDRQGPVEAVGGSVSEGWRVTRLTVSAIGRIFVSEKARSEVSGVVGSYETTRQVIKRFGFADAMHVLGLISLSLAIVNLFPFLPLDGGHIFWALAEKVRGRAISFTVMERASVVGFLLVIALFAIGLSNDIGRLQGDGFGVR